MRKAQPPTLQHGSLGYGYGVNPGDYGRIVRTGLDDHDRRIFVPTPHGSPGWQCGYNRRNALERTNNRIDNSPGFERHFIRGLAKMQTRVDLSPRHQTD